MTAEQCTFVEAINDALYQEMDRDERVVVLGEDVGKFGGVFRATKDLYETFGEERVIDTPLAEAGIVGTAIGMAMNGLRPVPEIQFADFIYPAFDQIVTELAKIRYRSGGEYSCPLVIRAPYGGGIGGGLYHSQSPEAYFMHTPGLKVVIPSTPDEAKGLLISAIRDPDPVLFFEPKVLYRQKSGPVTDGEHTVDIGEARVVREGTDVTVAAYGAMMERVRELVSQLEEQQIDPEILDLRTLLPYDEETLLSSVKKTGRFVIVHEAPKTAGPGAEFISSVAEEALVYLEAPPKRVTGYDTPFPYTLEEEYLPGEERITQAIEEVVDYNM